MTLNFMNSDLKQNTGLMYVYVERKGTELFMEDLREVHIK